MPKKKPENELTDKEQFERFKETVRKLGVDRTGQAMDKTFRQLSSDTKKSDPKPKD